MTCVTRRPRLEPRSEKAWQVGDGSRTCRALEIDIRSGLVTGCLGWGAIFGGRLFCIGLATGTFFICPPSL